MLREANRCPELRGRVKPNATRIGLWVDGVIVGFFTPHETDMGWRVGPLWVDPTYRGRRIAELAWRGYVDRVCVAFISNANEASRSLHERIGFVKWRRGCKGWFYRRLPA